MLRECRHKTKINFISRLVADSRDIALNHAAGLSSIQRKRDELYLVCTAMLW